MALTIELKGDKAILRNCEKLQKTSIKQAFRKQSKVECKTTLGTIANKVPVRTGALKRGLKVRAIPRSRKFIGSRVTILIKGKNNKKGWFYAAPQNYGWTINNKRDSKTGKFTTQKTNKVFKKLTGGKKVKGIHFMEKSKEQDKSRIQTNMRKVISETFKSEMTKK